MQAEDHRREKQSAAPIEFIKNLFCPLLGIVGNQDRATSAEPVDLKEALLKAHKKDSEFHPHDGAGHGFFCTHRSLHRAVIAGPTAIWIAGTMAQVLPRAALDFASLEVKSWKSGALRFKTYPRLQSS
jgi:dienelactone hydrolase